MGELVRRITGEFLTQFVSEEILKPLKADLQLGVPEKDWPRTVEMIPFSPKVMASAFSAVDPTSFVARAFAGSLMDLTIPNNPVFRKSENGAIGGFSTARALARIVFQILTYEYDSGTDCGFRILSRLTGWFCRWKAVPYSSNPR